MEGFRVGREHVCGEVGGCTCMLAFVCVNGCVCSTCVGGGECAWVKRHASIMLYHVVTVAWPLPDTRPSHVDQGTRTTPKARQGNQVTWKSRDLHLCSLLSASSIITSSRLTRPCSRSRRDSSYRL